MEKESGDYLKKLFSEQSKIYEFIFIGIMLGMGLNLIAGSITDLLKINPIFTLLFSIVIIIVVVLFLLIETFKNLNNDLNLTGFLCQDTVSDEIISVPRYYYGDRVRSYLSSIFSESETLLAIWKESRPDHSELLAEATSYYILTEISKHLNSFIGNQRDPLDELIDYGRDSLEEIVKYNRFLDLFSMTIDRRPRLDKSNYVPLVLKLPSGTVITSESSSEFIIKMKRMTLRVKVLCFPSPSLNLHSHAFKIIFLNKSDEDQLIDYEINVRLQVIFSKVSIFSKTGWGYYKWIDAFTNDLANNFSKEHFLRRIGWESTQTIIEGFDRLTQYKEQKKLQKIETTKLDRSTYLENNRLTNWLKSFHDNVSNELGIPNNLPVINFYGVDTQIPFLTKPEWNSPDSLEDLRKITPDKDLIIQYDQSFISDFDINYGLIDQRLLIGHRIWDAPTIFLDYISGSANEANFILHVKACRYYASLTKMIELENETINSIKNNDFTNCRLRRKYYTLTNNIESTLYKPLTLGCNIVFAVNTKAGYQVIIQTRSAQNVTDNNVVTTAPTYGLSPFVGGKPEKQGLLFYNFLEEYLEELHNVKDLDQQFITKSTPEGYYDSIYSHPEVVPLLSDKFGLYFLGFGFILSNGYPTIGLLAKVDDIDLGMHIKRTIKHNWEISDRTTPILGSHPLEFVSVDDSNRMKQLHRQFAPPAIFFLNSAIKYLLPPK